ncbi:hypothetical protein FO488_07685 [Geobacter sp. FeAm09]|uniref:sensor histidine kinase n=1 Tax=Geobacter sp. FeAm09 TaxID=2597769 RepID=UPI0011F04B54|nr:ABC transporter substrate binding protein [Geobacter sp. FeAm09]QEM68052.1 hypothetical protein FO488_07685 [Geobacter sp. FeAm09]
MRHLGAAYLVVLFTALTLAAAGPAHAAGSAEQKTRILILNSYHPYYSWSDNELIGIVETLRRARPDIEPTVEYLDCKYFPNMEHFGKIRDLFIQKYRHVTIPLVIAVDNPALDFALKYRDAIFPGAPLVFCGINGFEPAMLKGQSRVTGVAERLDVRGTVALMLKVHPATRQIFVIHDYTSTGLATRRQAEEDLKGFKEPVAIRYMDNLTTDDMLRQLSSLPADSLVLALSYSRDRDGRVFDHTKIAQLLGERSPVPVYGGHEERIGHGIIGGCLLGGKQHGAQAAEMALEILNGRDIATLPVYTGQTTRVVFDYTQLTRFHIPLSLLPYGCTIVNKPVSFYERYTRLVWTTIFVIASLGMIITLLAVNITQSRRAARELAVKAQELEKSNAELKEFNMLAYHDLQEPLRVIGGFVQLLEKRYAGKLDRDADEFIGIIVANVSHLKHLFNDLLTYLNLGRHPIRRAPLDGTEIVTGALAGLQEQIARRDASVTHAPFPQITGDRALLVMLLRHLLENALKFSRQTPVIAIECRCVEDRHIISVQDNGIGIAPEYREKIFSLFKKLHNRDEYPGTGIGLAVCKRIVELHGGRIWLESEPDKGSTFFFSLPAR